MRYINMACIGGIIIDKVKLKYSEENLSRCHSDHHKFHVVWPWIEPRLPR
jgi:hypothetical protein